MIRRTLKRSDYEADSYKAWNAFIRLLATNRLDELTATQRHPHFAFVYDSELQNGGHLQYFENLAVQCLDGDHYFIAALRGLEAVGASSQREVLSRAIERWGQCHRPCIQTVEEYVETARKEEFDDLDKAYYDCRPETRELLASYLDSHFDEFIELM